MTNVHLTAFNVHAPADEQYGALSSLQLDFLPTASDLLPMDAMAELIGEYAGSNPLAKAINPALSPYPSLTAKNRWPGAQSVKMDDLRANNQGQYYERPSTISFDALRQMTLQTPVLNAVVNTRVRQVLRFCRLSESDVAMPGFEIRHVDRKHAITESEQAKLALLGRFMSNCGFEFGVRERRKLGRDTFAQFMGKTVRDSLMLDSVAIETERRNDKGMGLAGFYAIDGATIRLCPETGFNNDPDLYAVQVVGGLVRTVYGYEDLVYEPRMPRSDVLAVGYGLPETEMLIRVVTGFLNAMTLNNNVFDKNSIPKGVLHLSGQYQPQDIEAFKLYWQSMVRGVDNAFAIPFLWSPNQDSKVSFEKFGVDFNEMMFAKWMTFLTSLICAIYGMSPQEINFDSFTGGNTSALAGSDTAEKLAASKDSGLRPLLAYFESLFTDYLIADFDEHFCFRWTGLDPDDINWKHDIKKTVLTLDELRAEEGYEKLGGNIGNAPINPALLNAWMQLQGQEQQDDAQEESDEGAEDENFEQGGALAKANINHDQLGQFAGADELTSDLPLHKAHGDDQHDLFAPHENPYIRVAVEDFTANGMIRLSAIRQDLDAWLAGQRYTGVSAAAPAPGMLYAPYWIQADADAVAAYLHSLPVSAFSADDYALLAKLLVYQHMPAGVMIDEAVAYTVQNLALGAADAKWQGLGYSQPMTMEQIAKLSAALPTTLDGIITAMRLSDAGQAALRFGAVRAAENVVQLADDTRHALQSTLMDWQVKKVAGDPEATVAKLQQTLFDKYATLNRDWRRIAITEAGNMALQGFIAACSPGTRVQRVEQYRGACPFCRKIDGKILTVVAADKPDKNGDTEVWEGKTNLGRSQAKNKRTENGIEPRSPHELWWVPAELTHPNCRGRWLRLPD